MSSFLRALLWLALALSFPCRAGEVLRIHGSNTIGARLAPALAEAWLRARGFERIERSEPAENETTLRAQRGADAIDVEVRAHGTSTGFDDLIAGNADLAMASRPASAAELDRARGIGGLAAAEQEAVIALDGVAVIVHPSNRLRALELTQLRAIFSGRTRDWADLDAAAGAIAVHARDEKSGTWETFRTLVLADAALRPEARRYESTQALAAAVARDPRAIGFVGLSGIGDARALSIADGTHALPPAVFSVAVEDYALSRRLFLYRSLDAPARVRDFVEFALSAEGQRVVQESGFVSQEIRAWPSHVRADAPDEYRALVRHAERLSLNFRFGRGSRLLDGKMLRDIDRLAAFLRREEFRGRPLLLFGFADRSETSAYLATTLSNDRVDLVARLLEDRGIAAQRSRGMGGTAPVAGNDTDAGRLRNRRVEVWIGPAPGATGGAVGRSLRR
jgi:phosphate transport system substrate-binding protein